MKKSISPRLVGFVAFVFIILCNSAFLQHSKAEDNKTLSPYFVVISDEDVEALLPLKSTSVEVDISGVIADVKVNQIYTNTGNGTIEAIYVFPASARAAVYDMKMLVGDREIRAKIQEKQKARQMYNKAKAMGKTSSLLEEDRPNVFKMRVANILPGTTVEVNLSYTELLIPRDNLYEFVYPTVVGPRYVSHQEIKNNGNKNWTGNPYLEEGVLPTSVLDINVNLSTGIPIKKILCETHKNNIHYADLSNANIKLNEPNGGNRDFILQYRLAGNAIESGVLRYEDANGENFFLAMIQPPERVRPEHIPAREYVFIVDVSGSMSGFPLDISKKLIRELLQNLRPKDKFNIVFFAGASNVYSQNSLQATSENINDAIEYLNSRSGGGGTELLSALKTAMHLNELGECSRSFVILTDGYVTVEKKTYDYIRNNLGNANFFSFGIGTSVNRYIIEGMAHVGYGEPFIAHTKTEAEIQAAKFKKYINKPVLTNINFDFVGFEATDIQPKYIPDLFAQRPIVICGKYTGSMQGSIKLTGKTGNGPFTSEIQMSANSKSSTKALKYLWAREKIRLLADYQNLRENEDTRTEILNLGLRYNLLTEYTSFIAIDSIVSNANGNQRTVVQALPLPDGVSEQAIGIKYPSNISTSLNIVSNDIELEDVLEVEDVEIDEDSQIEFMDHVSDEDEEVEESDVFVVVEKMPSFPGGEKALMKFLQDNVNYPRKAQNLGIQGRVFVQFMIGHSGLISNIKVVRAVHPILDKEAVRVISIMPKWTPGMQRGKAVNVRFMLPINFALDSDDFVNNDIYSEVDTMPKFKGGIDALKEYIETNIRYPEEAKEQGIKGTVSVNFVVEQDGTISHVKVLRGVHPLLNNEAIRLVESMPKWQPGMHEEKKVKVLMSLPVVFTINERPEN